MPQARTHRGIIARADGDHLDNDEADVLLWNLDRNGE